MAHRLFVHPHFGGVLSAILYYHAELDSIEEWFDINSLLAL